MWAGIIAGAGMRKTGWVAGLNHGAHDASAVLLKDGIPRVWIEQERLSRRKHAVGESPAQALAACLDHEDLTLGDLDVVALGSDHDDLARWLGVGGTERARILPYDDPERLFPRDVFQGEPKPPVMAVPHHLAHAASAHLVSGFEESAILVADAMGERTSVTLAHGRGRSIEIVEELGVQDSLGFFYEAACRYVGFTETQAGKLMGLAAYGVPRHPMPLEAKAIDDGLMWTLRDHADTPGRRGIEAREADLLSHFSQHCFPFACGRGDEVMAYKDFAASAQSALQACMLELAHRACKLTGSRRLSLAGGVALNCTANGGLAGADFLDALFVQPASTDSGVALGAALHVCEEMSGSTIAPFTMAHAYLGKASSRWEIRTALEQADLTFRELDEDGLTNAVARVLASDGVVAWHQGRGEVGPRALGARSLLGNPARRSTLVKLNQLKSREVWRPLAPSVLAEAFDDYFIGSPNPFMIVAARVRPEMQPRIAAVTHVDGSARPQAVYEHTAPRYAKLLRAVEVLTGIPIVVNTSLNGPTEPICYSAEDSIRFFKEVPVDALAIGDFLVVREEG